MPTQLDIFPVPANGVLTVEGGRFLARAGSGPVDIYLPHGSSPGLGFFIYDADRNAATNVITIRSVIGALINGASTLVLSTDGASVEIFSDGSDGFIATLSGTASGGSGGSFGVGSPEGVVTASPGGIYTTAAGEMWAKVTGTGNIGWIQLIGT